VNRDETHISHSTLCIR